MVNSALGFILSDGERKRNGNSRLLIESFNGKPRAPLPDFAYTCGSPLNENAQYNTQSTHCQGSHR
jgi:hypothetical protein